MQDTKKYAIKCTTEEQARECLDKSIMYTEFWFSEELDKMWFIQVTYDKAISLWLLGEKKEDLTKRWYAPWLYTYWKCSDCWCKLENVEKRAWRCKKCAGIEKQKELQSINEVEPVKESPSEDNLVENIVRTIMKRLENEKTRDGAINVWLSMARLICIEELDKHLSSK